MLGQVDLRQNALNSVEGAELFAPNGIALDARSGELHLYVADTGNHRVLGWRDANAFEIGAPADLVLGQPNFMQTRPLGIGNAGLNLPRSVAVDPASGDVYVADSGNHRVLRFPDPFSDVSRVEPDAVYGQPDFSSRGVNTGGLSNRSMRNPSAVAFDRLDNLWVADTDNHRVLRFPASMLDATQPTADLAIGQPNFVSGGANASTGQTTAGGFNSPTGLTFDAARNLYVSDFANARVLMFGSPQSFAQEASRVFGQTDFTSRGVPPETSGSTLRGPLGLATDAAGSLYVAVPLDSRVLVFENAAQAAAGVPADRVLGQPGLQGDFANRNTHPKAGPAGLFGSGDVAVDGDGNVFVADTSNNRVVAFTAGANQATKVWGQQDFMGNGPNRIEPSSISGAYQMVIDYSQAPCPLYVSDTNNHRILIWRDSRRFDNGAAADLGIGQPDLLTALANVDSGRGQTPSPASLSAPRGIALDAAGNLFVADSGNNRVLRYPRPVDQPGRITPDVVIGQGDFFSATSATISASRLRSPSSVNVGPGGTLFVSDTGNNRVLAFAPPLSTNAAAGRVFGQTGFSTGAPPTSVSAQSLSFPEGVFVDDFGFLYVADTGANRVVIYPNAEQQEPTSGGSASIVIGQPRFDTAVAQGGANRLRTPRNVGTDQEGKIYISDSENHRVLVFPSLLFLPVSDASATEVVGQPNLSSGRANWNSPDGFATAESLFAPVGIFVDRNSTLYVGDTGNNRVVHFLGLAVTANAVTFAPSVPIAPGSLATLGGIGFTAQEASATTVPLPETLAGVSVELLDRLKAPLLFANNTQINLQIPAEAPLGPSRISVRRADTDELLAGGFVEIANAGPAIFTEEFGGTGQALAINADGTRNNADNPAARGTFVTLFGTGQGEVTPPVPDGQAPPGGTIVNTVANPTSDGVACLTQQPSVCVAIGSKFGEVLFSGLAPGFVGLWQINVRIPQGEDVLTGDAIPIRVLINGRFSNTVNLAIE